MCFLARFRKKTSSSHTTKLRISAPIAISQSDNSPATSGYNDGSQSAPTSPATQHDATLRRLEGPYGARPASLTSAEEEDLPEPKALPSTKSFPFMYLPKELRLTVYDHLIHGRDHDPNEEPVLRMVCGGYCIGRHQPDFTLVCRAMRAESLPMFYRVNAFQFNFADPDVRYTQNYDMVTHWISIIGANNARHLRKIIITSEILHIRALTFECETGKFPAGKVRLEMKMQLFQGDMVMQESRECSLWLLETFLMNGFETGEDALVMTSENVLEIADLIWQLQRKIVACKHKVERHASRWCDVCDVYRYRRPAF